MKTNQILNLLSKGCNMLSPVQQSREMVLALNSFNKPNRMQLIKAVSDAFKMTCPVRYFSTYTTSKDLNAKTLRYQNRV